MVGTVLYFFAASIHCQFSFSGQACAAIDHGNTVFLHEIANATRQASCYIPAVFHQAFEIETHLTRGKSVVRCVSKSVGDFGPFEQRLGRNATPVKTDATQVLFLYQRCVQAQLGGANGGHIAAGSAAYYDQIKGRRHDTLLRPASVTGFR